MTSRVGADIRSRVRALGGRIALAAAASLAVFAAAHAGPSELPRRGYLGVGVAEPDSANAERLGTEPGAGVWVQALAGTSPLRDAGVAVDDVVVALAGRPTPTASAFAEVAASLGAGAAIDVTLLRAGRTVRARVIVAERPRERVPGLEVDYGAFETDGGVRLRAIVARPAPGGDPARRNAPRPAVLVVQDLTGGSVEPGGYGPERELAFALARAGYVAMRFDRRGVGDSEGGIYLALSFERSMRDLHAALTHLRARPDVDGDRIHLVAFGAGGVQAATLAGDGPPLAGVVCVAPPARPWAEMPVPRAPTFVRELTRRTSAEAIARTPAPLALLAPGADPVVGPEDAARIVARRRALGIDPADVLEIPGTDALLARATSPEASASQRRQGLFAFSSDAAAAIVRWLDARAGASAARAGEVTR